MNKDHQAADSTEDRELPLAAHMLELRKRLLRIILVILVIFGGLFSFANLLYELLALPLLEVLPAGSQMIATEVAAPFLAPFKLAMIVATFIAMPYVLIEAWGFIAPGLFSHEKRLLAPVIFSSICLFYAGVAFAYFAVFPVMFNFFSLSGPENIAYTPDISRFLDTVVKLFFAFGVAFEIPIAIVVLIKTGAITAQSLSAKRPYAIVCCFIFGMLLTPPDPISQCMMALPMWLLFECGLIIGRLISSQQSDDS